MFWTMCGVVVHPVNHVVCARSSRGAQIGASVWYSASYIPYGRRMIIRCCQASLFKPCPEACKPVETFTGA